TMESRADKGKELVVSEKGLKWLIKETKGSKSSTVKGSHVTRFGAKAREEHGIKWFNAQNKAKYAPKNLIDEGRLALEYPTICGTIRELGLGYVFVEPEECTLTLVRKFYDKWDTSFGESTKVKIKGQVVRISARSFSAFLCTPVVNPSMYAVFLEKPPYLDIHHTLYGEHLASQWARDHMGTYSTLLFSYLNKEDRVWS
ncbi:hypothetical protein HAX54_029702, partial [Datura stramonium]|nr:hypothetical protein [Datura stramonium]